MLSSRACPGKVAAVVLAFCLAGCSESSPFRFGDMRRSERAQGPPQPAPALFIPKAPAVAREIRDENVKPATFVPDREPPPADAKPQMIEHPLNVLYQRAAERHATMDSYIFRLKRREVVNGKKQPEEVVRVHVRREPYSVHLVWLNDKSKGREVIYVSGKYDNKMQVLLAPNDPFALLGRRHSIAPDDPLVRTETRYLITETGLGPLIDRFGRMIAAIDKGDPRAGTAKYLGRVQRPEFEAKVEAVHQTIPAGSDALFPKGGERWWYFDASNGLPLLVIAHDPSGEVEYYCHDNVLFPAPMDDSDFNTDRVWRK